MNESNQRVNDDAGNSLKIAFVLQPVDVLFHDRANVSSIPILTYELARRLARRHRVTIYARRARSQPSEHTASAKLRYRFIKNRRDDWSEHAYEQARRMMGDRLVQRPAYASLWFRPRYILSILRDLRREAYDVIHIHNFSQFVPLIRRASPHSKIVLHMHCEWLTQLDRAMIEGRIKHADLVLSCSNYITEQTRRRFPEYAGRCRTLFNGVDVDMTNSLATGAPPSKPALNEGRRILFVGRLSPEKGPHVLLQSFAAVLERFPGARLELIGPHGAVPYDFVAGTSASERLEHLATFFGESDYEAYLYSLLTPTMTDRVSFPGALPHSEVLQRMRAADVLAFPVVWNEPFGMPVAEAMAQGLPVVASRSGGILDIVAEGETGLLVEPGDPEALANALQFLLEDATLQKHMRRAGRERARQLFSWDGIVQTLQEYYANQHL